MHTQKVELALKAANPELPQDGAKHGVTGRVASFRHPGRCPEAPELLSTLSSEHTEESKFKFRASEDKGEERPRQLRTPRSPCRECQGDLVGTVQIIHQASCNPGTRDVARTQPGDKCPGCAASGPTQPGGTLKGQHRQS